MDSIVSSSERMSDEEFSSLNGVVFRHLPFMMTKLRDLGILYSILAHVRTFVQRVSNIWVSATPNAMRFMSCMKTLMRVGFLPSEVMHLRAVQLIMKEIGKRVDAKKR